MIDEAQGIEGRSQGGSGLRGFGREAGREERAGENGGPGCELLHQRAPIPGEAAPEAPSVAPPPKRKRIVVIGPNGVQQPARNKREAMEIARFGHVLRKRKGA